MKFRYQKTIATCCLLLLACFPARPFLECGTVIAEAQDSRTESEFSLDNGLKVYLLPYSGSSLVTIVLAIKVGTADENSRTSGLIHLLEHCLLFRQSHLTAEGRLFRIINQHGLYYNARTEQDLMFFEVSLSRDQIETGLGLLKEVIFSFNLTEEALEQEKAVLLRELAENCRQPEKVGLARVYQLAFPETGYALPVYGKKKLSAGQASLVSGTFTRNISGLTMRPWWWSEILNRKNSNDLVAVLRRQMTSCCLATGSADMDKNGESAGKYFSFLCKKLDRKHIETAHLRMTMELSVEIAMNYVEPFNLTFLNSFFISFKAIVSRFIQFDVR